MDIELLENERLFTEYLARQTIPDPYDFTFDLDSFRSQHPQVAQEIIRDPCKFYRLAKAFL